MDYSAARWDDGEGPKKSLFKCDTENLCNLSASQETDCGGFTALNTVFSNVFLAAKCHLIFWDASLRRMISGGFHLCCIRDWDLITRKEPWIAMFSWQMFPNLPVWQVPRKCPIQESVMSEVIWIWLSKTSWQWSGWKYKIQLRIQTQDISTLDFHTSWLKQQQEMWKLLKLKTSEGLKWWRAARSHGVAVTPSRKWIQTFHLDWMPSFDSLMHIH